MSITINHEPVVWSAHGSFLSEGHKYGVRKLMKTHVIEFCDKKPVVVFLGLINIYMSTYSQRGTV